MVRRINNALMRADQIQISEGKVITDYFLPIVADAEAGFGGPLHSFELMRAMIEAGAAGVHFEDQLASEKEMRPFGGQGFIAGATSYQQLGRGPARFRRVASTDRFGGTHRCSERDLHDVGR